VSGDLEIIAFETSSKVKLSGVPYMMLRLNGSSYLNKRAAALLNLQHGDVVRFFFKKDLSTWWIGNHPVNGAAVQKNGGLFKFCDVPAIRMLFDHLGIKGPDPKKTKAFFILGTELEQIDVAGVPYKVLFVKPKPINLE
jgi:hypothetical protein